MGKILILQDIFELRFDFENMLLGLALSSDLDGRSSLINRLPFSAHLTHYSEVFTRLKEKGQNPIILD